MTQEVRLWTLGRTRCVLRRQWAGDLPMAIRFQGRTYVRFAPTADYDWTNIVDWVLHDDRALEGG